MRLAWYSLYGLLVSGCLLLMQMEVYGEPLHWVQETKLKTSDDTGDDYFGRSVSVDGDTAVVGVDVSQRAVYVFVRSGNAWPHQALLTASDGAEEDGFGLSVAVDGDTAVVGAYGKNNYQGAVYVFERNGETWNQEAILTASDGVAEDIFGWNVDVDGDTVVVGAPYKNSRQGATYVFSRSGETWTQQAILTLSDGATNDYFGGNVAVDGDTVVVGAYGKNNQQGAAYLFERSGGGWTPQAILTASDGAANDHFGSSVAINGDTVVVGASYKNNSQGAAYIFVRSGASWSQQTILTSSDGAIGDSFGASVAMDGDMVAVGVPDRNNSRGAVYVFERNASTWTQQAILAASDGAVNHIFGNSVAMNGNTVVIGAPSSVYCPLWGAAYVFRRTENLNFLLWTR